MRDKLLSILFIFLFFFASITAFSQVSGAPDPDCDPQIDPTCQQRYPITESIILLLAGGFGLGIKVIAKKRKNN